MMERRRLWLGYFQAELNLTFQVNPYFQWQDGGGNNYFQSDYQSDYHGGMLGEGALPTDTEATSKYTHDILRTATEAPGLFDKVNENFFNFHNLHSFTDLNPAAPAQQPFLQPSLCQVLEWIGVGYRCQQPDFSVCVFLFSKSVLIFLHFVERSHYPNAWEN